MSVSSSSPIAAVVALGIKHTATRAELDTYAELIHARHTELRMIAEQEALAIMCSEATAKLPDYADIVKTITVFKQKRYNADPYTAEADGRAFFLWWYDGVAHCSLKWDGYEGALLLIGPNKCEFKGDSRRTLPKRIKKFMFAMHDAGINITKARAEAMKKI